ncbi:MAG TPA: DNA-processing protein DprA [Roseiflexaceae bacterium]|nr:DNA-processing protein DprA [Roseiflexaceae bacterium]HMP41108.1 DNA-processing protein DprA [Roseiflexaceae bacterium]
MDTTRYYIAFNRVNGIGPARLDRLIAACGSIEAAWHAPLRDLVAAGLEPRLAQALCEQRASLDLDAELEHLARSGISAVSRENPAYPAALATIPAAPPLIYVRGRLSDVDSWAVAIVGTRSPTSYGRDVARRLATDLAAAGVTIVSGLAIGIDALAHEAALEAGGRTIAVLACGVDLIYPERHTTLAARIRTAGAVVSEFPIGLKPMPQLFPVRNRLISGLARGVLVVEADYASGALITVDYALDQGRDVFAVPGSIFSPKSNGPNQLIRNGAALVSSAADILDALDLTRSTSQREIQTALPDGPVEAGILALLSHEPRHIDELRRMLDTPVAEVSAALTLLELKGLVRQHAAMQYVIAR